MSQIKITDFAGETYKGFEVQRRRNCSSATSFTNCVKTLYLLKVHLQKFLSIPITQKCQILSCDTLVANKRYSVQEQEKIQDSESEPVRYDTTDRGRGKVMYLYCRGTGENTGV